MHKSNKLGTAFQISLEEVKVNGLRTNAKQPMPFTNVDKNELAERNLGKTFPFYSISYPVL